MKGMSNTKKFVHLTRSASNTDKGRRNEITLTSWEFFINKIDRWVVKRIVKTSYTEVMLYLSKA